MRLSLRTRILLAFVLSFALFLSAIGYGNFQLRALGDGLEVVNDGYLPLARTAAQLDSYQNRIDLDAARLQRDPGRPLAAFRSNAVLHAEAITTAVEQGRITANRALEATATLEERRALDTVIQQLDRLALLAQGYQLANQQWVAEVEKGEPASIQAAQADLLRSQKELQTAVRKLNATLEASIRRVNDAIARSQARATLLGGVLSALALAFGAAMLGWTLLTLRPIGRLTTEVQRVAGGDYSGRVDVHSEDEIGVLAAEFNDMARNLDERDKRLVERAEQLKRLSGYLRSVLDSIHLGLVVLEEERVTMANPAAHSLWGLEEGAKLPVALEPLEAGRHEALAMGELRLDVEVVPFGRRGRLLVGEDVTRRLQDQERLARSERLALIGQMLAQVTHEVRNPLNAISLNAELLGEELQAQLRDPSESMEILGIIIQEIHRLEEVTEHYLDLARRPAASFQPEDIADLLRSVLQLEEAAFQQAGIALSMEAERGAALVAADDSQLRRALLNILRNAQQSGAKKVDVTLALQPQRCSITVADDGGGMDPQKLEKVFEPFFSTRSRGTGLGLAITRQIIEDHDGRIRCHTLPGQGFRVVIELPRVWPVDDPPEKAAPFSREPPFSVQSST